MCLGPVAQSVEQRIENPCVGGSIPSQATKFYLAKKPTHAVGFFVSANKQSSCTVYFRAGIFFGKKLSASHFVGANLKVTRPNTLISHKPLTQTDEIGWPFQDRCVAGELLD